MDSASIARSCSLTSWKRTNLDPRVCSCSALAPPLAAATAAGAASSGWNCLPGALPRSPRHS